MRRALAVVLLAHCATHEGIAAHDANAVAREDLPKRAITADATLERMSRARELAIVRNVDRVVLSREDLLAKLKWHVARTVPRAEIDREDAFLKGMAALGFGESYESAVYDALRGSLAGMYEPFDGKMYVRDDVSDETLAHESVHALQDQHFDLAAWEKFVPGASDAMLARACLAEGDAAIAAGESPSATGRTSYVERELAAPYIAGAAFVKALRARGGWATVDEAWTRGALTTEQVLHPEKWFAKESGERVPPPTIAALGSEFRDATSDVHGELAVSLVLGAYSERAARAAAGWAGDASTVARAGDRVAIAWRIRWDDEDGAKRAFEALSSRGDHHCEANASGDRRGREVLLLTGPPRSDCALLERWSKEIFSN